MPQYTVGCLTFTDNNPDSYHYGLTNVDFSTNAEFQGNDSGSLYEEFNAITGFAPVATLTSKAVAQLINNIGLGGACIGPTQQLTQVDVISRKLETCQDVLGATPHIRDRCTQGLIRLGSLSADRGQDATITAILDTFTDATGANAPVARTIGVAMPTPIEVERLTLGQCSIANVVYPEIESVSVDFGVNVSEKLPALGNIWPEAIGVRTIRPILTLRGRDLSKVTAAMMAFSATQATHANTVIQLIRRKNAGAFEPFANAVHTRLTLAGLVIPDTLVSASANQNATHSIRVAAAYDGTNAPVLFNTAIAHDTTPP